MLLTVQNPAAKKQRQSPKQPTLEQRLPPKQPTLEQRLPPVPKRRCVATQRRDAQSAGQSSSGIKEEGTVFKSDPHDEPVKEEDEWWSALDPDPFHEPDPDPLHEPDPDPLHEPDPNFEQEPDPDLPDLWQDEAFAEDPDFEQDPDCDQEPYFPAATLADFNPEAAVCQEGKEEEDQEAEEDAADEDLEGGGTFAEDASGDAELANTLHTLESKIQELKRVYRQTSKRMGQQVRAKETSARWAAKRAAKAAQAEEQASAAQWRSQQLSYVFRVMKWCSSAMETILIGMNVPPVPLPPTRRMAATGEIIGAPAGRGGRGKGWKKK
jgi:hypothetical protein